METLALASVGGSTHNVYWSEWQANLVPPQSDGRKESMVGKKREWGRRRSESVGKFHDPAMLGAQNFVKRSEDV